MDRTWLLDKFIELFPRFKIRFEILELFSEKENPCPASVQWCSWEKYIRRGINIAGWVHGGLFGRWIIAKSSGFMPASRVHLAQLHPAVSCDWGIVVIGTPQINTNDTRNPSHSSHTLCAYTWAHRTIGSQKNTHKHTYSTWEEEQWGQERLPNMYYVTNSRTICCEMFVKTLK